MKLYYSTGACSLASNIALHEAGIAFDLVKVNGRDKTTTDGRNFNAINSKGYVPALELDSGEILTENVALLGYIADLAPDAHLAPPPGTMQRYRLNEYLSFINSELHKSFTPIFHSSTEDTKTEFRHTAAKRLGWLEQDLGSKDYLLGDTFTVADAYLFTVLSWAGPARVDLTPFPNLQRFQQRVMTRPSVVAAMAAEGLKRKA